MTKKVKTVTEEVIADEKIDVIDEKDRKVERFFNFFKNEENYTITLYKVGDRGKAALVERYENEVPDLLKVREVWGGGTYKLYAHSFDNELMDTTVVHIAEAPEGKFTSGDNEETFLMKALKYKELLGGGSGNNEIMLKMMEMQSSFTQSISTLISKMNEKNLETQLQIERRMADIVEKQSANKNGFTDLIQAAEFINMIKGDSGEGTLLDKILGNPVFQNIAGGLVSQFNTPVQKTAPAQIAQQPASGGIPQEFIDKVTRENREVAIENVMKAYQIPRDRAETIIDGILKSKGL